MSIEVGFSFQKLDLYERCCFSNVSEKKAIMQMSS